MYIRAKTPFRKVEEVTSGGRAHPDVVGAVTVGQKRNQLFIGGDGRVLLIAVGISGESLDCSIIERVQCRVRRADGKDQPGNPGDDATHTARTSRRTDKRNCRK